MRKIYSSADIALNAGAINLIGLTVGLPMGGRSMERLGKVSQDFPHQRVYSTMNQRVCHRAIFLARGSVSSEEPAWQVERARNEGATVTP